MKTFKLTISIFCFVLLFAPYSAHSETDSIFDRIQAAVKENLAKSISDRAVLEELRALRGAEYLGAGSSGMTISGLYMDGYSGRNRVIYSVYLRDAKQRTINVVVEASYDMLTDVYVTSRPLSRGDVISRSDYYAVRQKLSRLPVGAITDSKDIDGKTLKVSLTDGAVIRSQHLQSAMTVRKGKKVSLLIEGNSIVISARGSLKNDAMVGDSASVVCDLTKKEVHGVLVTPNLVKVKI